MRYQLSHMGQLNQGIQLGQLNRLDQLQVNESSDLNHIDSLVVQHGKDGSEQTEARFTP